MMKHFFIAGCSRSGEQEIGVCLGAVGGMTVVNASATRALFDNGDEAIDLSGWVDDVTVALGFDVTRQTLQLQTGIDDVARRQGWKEVAPPFVFLVREPRACVAHMAQRKLGPLLDAFGMPPLDELRADWQEEVETIEAASPATAVYGRAALWWKMNYAVLEQLREAGETVIAVSYDSFCESPAPHLRAICEALDVPFSPAELPLHGGYSDEQWRGLLSDEQRELIEAVAGSAMRSAWQTGRRS